MTPCCSRQAAMSHRRSCCLRYCPVRQLLRHAAALSTLLCGPPAVAASSRARRSLLATMHVSTGLLLRSQRSSSRRERNPERSLQQLASSQPATASAGRPSLRSRSAAWSGNSVGDCTAMHLQALAGCMPLRNYWAQQVLMQRLEVTEAWPVLFGNQVWQAAHLSTVLHILCRAASSCWPQA